MFELELGHVAFLVSAACFIGVLAIAFAVRTIMNPERTARDRVSELRGGTDVADSLLSTNPAVGGVAGNLGALARPRKTDEAEEARRRLLQAGFRNADALELFSALRAGLALVIPLVLLIALPSMEMAYKLFFVMFGAAAGYYAPSIIINNRIAGRKEKLMKPFPDALDLLVSSVEAGLGLDAAFRRVATEIEGAAPELAKELQQVNHEVSAGVPRVDALRRFDHRTGLAEVNQLVNVLLQAERFGTSVAKALRIHSNLVRKKRMLAAEEKAAKISPKLTVAMIVFILPGLIIVLAGPAIINVVNNLLPAMSGQ